MEADTVIDRIYDCATTDTGWNTLLEDVADLAGGDVAWLVFSAPALRMSSVIAPRSDPEVIARYESHWWREDPTLAVASTAPVGRITTLADTGRERFLGSAFYNEFWRSSGHASERIACNLHCAAGVTASIGLQPARRSESIEPAMLQTFVLLLPHLIRATRIRCRMREMELESALARSKARSCLVLVDADCRVVFADDRALAILSGGFGARVDDGHVVLGLADETACLHRMVRACLPRSGRQVRGGRAIPASAGGRRMQIDVIPFHEAALLPSPVFAVSPPPAAILILSDPEALRREALDVLRGTFGLTDAEAAVALELLRADGRAAAAERLGIALSTVRTHMMHIFAKVGVTSQAALISQMARSGVTGEDVRRS